jgi:phenol hydroxylase P0 protein
MSQESKKSERYFVRLLGTKKDRYVEFEFAIDSPELSVELLLPLDHFRDFCRRYQVEFLKPQPEAALAFERLTQQ